MSAKLYVFDFSGEKAFIAATSKKGAVKIFKKWYKALQDQYGDDVWTKEILSDSLDSFKDSDPKGARDRGYPLLIS